MCARISPGAPPPSSSLSLSHPLRRPLVSRAYVFLPLSLRSRSRSADRHAKRKKLIEPFATSFDGDDAFTGVQTTDIGGKLAGHRRRIFIVAEGLCERTGRIAPLKDLVAAKEEFGCYLVLDESHSIGVLGATGRGLCEHVNVDKACVDLQVASLETVLGSVGGFCAGTNDTIFRQTLMGSGYCFSAASPPCTAAAAEEALKCITEEPQRGVDLADVATRAHDYISEALAAADSALRLAGDRGSPILYLELPPHASAPEAAAARHHVLERVVADVVAALDGAVAICVVHEVEQSWSPAPPPGEPRVRFCLSADHAGAARATLIERTAGGLVDGVAAYLNDAAKVAEANAAALDDGGFSPRARDAPARARTRSQTKSEVRAELEAEYERERVEAQNKAWPPAAPLLWNLIVGVVGFLRRGLQQMMVLQMQVVTTSRVRTRSASDGGGDKSRGAAPPTSTSGDASRLWSAWRDTFASTVAVVSQAAFQCGAQVPMVLWTGNHAFSRRLIVAFALTSYLGNVLKNLFCMPRPPRRYVHPSAVKQSDASYAWPSQYGIMAASLPVFINAFLTPEDWAWTAGTWTCALHTTVLVGWVTCGAIARVYYGLTAFEDMVAGGVVGFFAARAWLPFSAVVDAWVAGQHPLLGAALPFAALLLVLLHPNPSVSKKSRASAPFIESLSVLGHAAGYTAGAWLRGGAGAMLRLPRLVPASIGAVSPLALDVVGGLQHALVALLLVFFANQCVTRALAIAFKKTGIQARIGIPGARAIMLSTTAVVIGATIALAVPSAARADALGRAQ